MKSSVFIISKSIDKTFTVKVLSMDIEIKKTLLVIFLSLNTTSNENHIIMRAYEKISAIIENIVCYRECHIKEIWQNRGDIINRMCDVTFFSVHPTFSNGIIKFIYSHLIWDVTFNSFYRHSLFLTMNYEQTFLLWAFNAIVVALS